MEFITIGKLAKAAGVSADTLRYYDGIGLLKPVHVDGDSGYRYYSAGQAADIARIGEMKEYGFSLAEIKEMLTLPQSEMGGIYAKRHGLLIHQREVLDAAIAKIADKIQIDREAIMMKKVLIIDDAGIMRMMLKDILTKGGYEVIGDGADSGAAGVRMYGEHRPDIVMMNYVMPKMDGVAALTAIREIDPAAKVLMVSAMSKAAVVADALAAGAAGFVAKPFQSDVLLETVAEVLADNKTAYYYNTLTLERIRAAAKDDILFQKDVDSLIESTKTALTDDEINGLLEEMAKAPPPPPPAEIIKLVNAYENTQIIDMLEKILDGQEKTNSLLASLAKNK